MKTNRRNFVKHGLALVAAAPSMRAVATVGGESHHPVHGQVFEDGKRLGCIVNSDINHTLYSSPGKNITPRWYEDDVLLALMFGQPGVYAQDVGLPDPVIFRSQVATTFDRYLVEVSLMTWPKESPKVIREDAARQADAMVKLLESGTDPLALTVEACRKRGVAIVASFRMNAEDWYQNTWRLSDFGRAHPEWRIPNTGALDPAIPGVYDHRMRIFTEVAEQYDIDGIEFNFRRWYHMVSEPQKNYPVLTRMVRDTRKVLDEVAKKKGRGKLLLGARVGPNLNEKPLKALYPSTPWVSSGELSCKDLGLDVKTWIDEGLVDYLCPSMFSGTVDRSRPGEKEFVKVAEFVELAKNSRCGIYPTIWHYTGKAKSDEKANENGEVMVGEADSQAMGKYKEALCQSALACYDQGAEGVSTFNWFLPDCSASRFGRGAQNIALYIFPKLGKPEALRQYLKRENVLPEGFLLRAYRASE